MKDYIVTLTFNLDGITITTSFCRAENESAALFQALTISGHPVKLMTSQSVQEVPPGFSVLNNDYDVISSKDVISMKVEGMKLNSTLVKDLIELAEKHSLDGIVKALSD